MRRAFKKAFQDLKDVVDGKDESIGMSAMLFPVLTISHRLLPRTVDKGLKRTDAEANDTRHRLVSNPKMCIASTTILLNNS